MKLILCDMCLKRLPIDAFNVDVAFTIQSAREPEHHYEICRDCYNKLKNMFIDSSKSIKISKVEL